MLSWSTYEIELLIREIEKMQSFWNMYNPEYKDRIKKSDAWKQFWEVWYRDQMEISFCSLFRRAKGHFSISTCMGVGFLP